jgi:hypothetical protein
METQDLLKLEDKNSDNYVNYLHSLFVDYFINVINDTFIEKINEDLSIEFNIYYVRDTELGLSNFLNEVLTDDFNTTENNILEFFKEDLNDLIKSK